MTKEDLYGIAFQYKKTSIWKKIDENEIFSIKMKDGRIGYIRIDGKRDNICSINIFVGDEGLKSLQALQKKTDEEVNLLDVNEVILGRKCVELEFTFKSELDEDEARKIKNYAKKNGISLAGKKMYPFITASEPYIIPATDLSEEQIDALYQAIEAAILINDLIKNTSLKNLGFISICKGMCMIPLFEVKDGTITKIGTTDYAKKIEISYEYVEAKNHIMLQTVRKIKKKGIWEMQFVHYPNPDMDIENNTLYFPLTLLAIDIESYDCLRLDVIEKDNNQRVLMDFAKMCKDVKRYPCEIRCKDEFTYGIFKDFCEKTGARISIYDGEMVAIADAKRDFFDCQMKEFWGEDEEEDDDIYDAPFGDEEDEFEELINMIINVPDKAMKEMPKKLKKEMLQELPFEELPAFVANEIKRKLKL